MYCQKCRGPLKVDGSLDDLNPAAYNILLTTTSQQTKKPHGLSRQKPCLDPRRQSVYDEASKTCGDGGPVFKRHGGSLRDGSMSYVFLSDSQVTPRFATGSISKHDQSSIRTNALTSVDDITPEPSHEMERIKKLWEILSARSDVDHPLCVDCTEVLLDGMKKKLESAIRDRDSLASTLKELQASLPSEEELKEAEAMLTEAKTKKEKAMEELLNLEREKAEVDSELAQLEQEARALDETEKEFWRSRNAFDTKLAAFQGERDSVNIKFDHDSQLLEKLQRTNVYNDTFCISHDGTFATINGLRLGRTGGSRNVTVDWPEINAAWGHALLLLVTVAEKLNFKFEGLEPQPMGSTSRIIRLEQPSPASSRLVSNRLQSFLPPPPAAAKRTALDLFYSSENLSLGRMFSRGRFGDAMVAFLELVKQLGTHVKEDTACNSTTGALSLPYIIKDDRIDDVSIRLGIGQDEPWTKACKLTLTCCKFLLAHASNVSYSAAVRAANV